MSLVPYNQGGWLDTFIPVDAHIILPVIESVVPFYSQVQAGFDIFNLARSVYNSYSSVSSAVSNSRGVSSGISTLKKSYKRDVIVDSVVSRRVNGSLSKQSTSASPFAFAEKRRGSRSRWAYKRPKKAWFT